MASTFHFPASTFPVLELHMCSLSPCGAMLRGRAADGFVRAGNHATPQLHAYGPAAQFLGEGPCVLSPAPPRPSMQFLAHRDDLVTVGREGGHRHWVRSQVALVPSFLYPNRRADKHPCSSSHAPPPAWTTRCFHALMYADVYCVTFKCELSIFS